MEKNNGVRMLAAFALVVAIAGLSVGFAAFSTTLKIDTAAQVTASTGNWNVGFSTDGTTIESTGRTKDANETGNPGKIMVKKYTISQDTNATLSTTENSSVSYTLDILNKGNMTAYLDSVDFSNIAVTCTNVSGNTVTPIDVENGAGTSVIGGNTTTISNEDCAKMFAVSLNIGGVSGTTYTTSASSITGSSIAKNSSAPVTLTVSYTNSSDAQAVAATLNGDIIVNIGSVSVVYTSTAPAAGGGA